MAAAAAAAWSGEGRSAGLEGSGAASGGAVDEGQRVCAKLMASWQGCSVGAPAQGARSEVDLCGMLHATFAFVPHECAGPPLPAAAAPLLGGLCDACCPSPLDLKLLRLELVFDVMATMQRLEFAAPLLRSPFTALFLQGGGGGQAEGGAGALLVGAGGGLSSLEGVRSGARAVSSAGSGSGGSRISSSSGGSSSGSSSGSSNRCRGTGNRSSDRCAPLSA